MNTLKKLVLPVVLALAAATASAQAPEGRLYTPGSFDRLEIDGSAQVRLVQGERDQVFVSGGPEVQNEVEISLSGNRLRINPTGGWKFWNSARPIEITLRQLTRVVLSGNTDLHAPGPIKGDNLVISISGAGVVRFDDLNVGSLRFDVSGAGDGQLVGQTQSLSVNVSGKGKLQAEQLRASDASVSISGVGNASLWVTDTMRVTVSGIGNVDYWGQPTVRRSISGVGNIVARGDKR